MRLRKAGGADGPVKPFDSPEAISLGSGITLSATTPLRHQYKTARARLDASSCLLARALDLLELLHVGVLDLDDATELVKELKRATANLKRRRGT